MTREEPEREKQGTEGVPCLALSASREQHPDPDHEAGDEDAPRDRFEGEVQRLPASMAMMSSTSAPTGPPTP